MSPLEKVPKGRKDHREGCARPLVACYSKNPFIRIKWLETSPKRATEPNWLFLVDSLKSAAKIGNQQETAKNFVCTKVHTN